MTVAADALRNLLVSAGRVADLIEADELSEALEVLHLVMDGMEEAIDNLEGGGAR